MSDASLPEKPSIEVVAVEWEWRSSAASNGPRRPAELATASIRWMDVVCNVCHVEFRAARALSAGQPGFYPMVYNVTIGCECGAVAGLRIDQLQH